MNHSPLPPPGAPYRAAEPALADDVLSALLRNEAADAPTPADAEGLARVKARVAQGIRAPQPSAEPPSMITTAAAEGRWRAYLAGIERKTLLRKGDDVSVLLRMQAGSVLPAHFHAADEYCIVISGRLRLQQSGIGIGVGGFHWVAQNTAHEPIVADEETLVYLRGALDLQ